MIERETIKLLFDRLINAPLESFPLTRGTLNIPEQHGVYVIYGARGRVLYVGRTQRAVIRSGSGLRRRLANHRTKYGRKGCKFRCLVIENPRRRALLEAYATGCLCPADLGLGNEANQPWLIPPISK